MPTCTSPAISWMIRPETGLFIHYSWPSAFFTSVGIWEFVRTSWRESRLATWALCHTEKMFIIQMLTISQNHILHPSEGIWLYLAQVSKSKQHHLTKDTDDDTSNKHKTDYTRVTNERRRTATTTTTATVTTTTPTTLQDQFETTLRFQDVKLQHAAKCVTALQILCWAQRTLFSKKGPRLWLNMINIYI